MHKRHQFKLRVPAYHIEMKKLMFVFRSAFLWKSLSSKVAEVSCHLVAFKRLLADFLGETLFEYDDRSGSLGDSGVALCNVK